MNGDATFSFCRVAVNMIGLGVNSVGNHTHPVCWSIIQHNTEGELTYTGTFHEMQDAFFLLEDIHTCGKLECEFCKSYNLNMLKENENVKKYFATRILRSFAGFQLTLHSATRSKAGATLLVKVWASIRIRARFI